MFAFPQLPREINQVIDEYKQAAEYKMYKKAHKRQYKRVLEQLKFQSTILKAEINDGASTAMLKKCLYVTMKVPVNMRHCSVQILWRVEKRTDIKLPFLTYHQKLMRAELIEKQLAEQKAREHARAYYAANKKGWFRRLFG